MACKVRLIDNKVRKRLHKQSLSVLALLFSLFMLTACPAPGPDCVEADDWGQTENVTVKIDPTKRYNSAGISVLAGEPLAIAEGGNIDLCPDATTINAVVPETDTATRKKITPAKRGWQDSGIQVKEGDKLIITISNGYKDSSDTMQTSGRGLYAYITPDNITSSDPRNDEWWYGKPGVSGFFSSRNRLAMDNAITCHPDPSGRTKADGTPACNPFFELYNNGTSGAGGGYTGIAPASGKLYFRYARTASSRTLYNRGENAATPWKGPHRWPSTERCNVCRETTIVAVCTAVGAATLGAGFFPCMVGWHIDCEKSGHLEYSILDWGKYKRSKCQEWYPDSAPGARPDSHAAGPGSYWGNNGGDHFVNENAIDSATGAGAVYNDGPGYDITISNGCPGVFGRYMNMLIGESTAVMSPATTPQGCRVGTAGCNVNRDDFTGEVIMEPEYTVTPTNITDMNSSGIKPDGSYSSPALPEGFRTRGQYSHPVPASGELWFEILDTETEKSANNPRGGYYPDNIGNYELNIRTTKVLTAGSGFISHLINPIRDIISGHCSTNRAEDGTVLARPTQDECFPKATPTVDARGNPVLGVDGVQLVTPGAWKQGLTQRVYTNLVGSGVFINIVRTGMVLMMVFWSMAFMLGMIKDVQDDIIKRVIKVALVIQLISPGSWQFFNAYLFSVFIDGMDTMISLVGGAFTGASSGNGVEILSPGNPFAFVDATLSKFFNWSTLLKILGLIFSSPMGFLYFFAIIVGVVIFLVAILRAVILYILAMIVISLLLILAPIFITFLLFDGTKSYFEKWIKSLISYFFQPVFVIAILAIFNLFIYSALQNLLHYRVCWRALTAINIDLGPIGHIGPIPLPLLNFYLPAGGLDGNPILDSGMPIGFFMILIFLIISNAMLKFVDLMANLPGQLTLGSGTSLSGPAADILGSVGNIMKMTGSKAVELAKAGAKKGAKSASKDENKNKKTPRK